MSGASPPYALETSADGSRGTLSVVVPAHNEEATLAEVVRKVATLSSHYRATFGDVAERLSSDLPDSIIYVNVLEHIADDVGELALVHRTLAPGGKIFIFVPALQSLYGAFDEQVGHHRRYTRSELVDKCERAGFRIIDSRYFDLLGVLPWWVKYRLLKSSELEPRAVAAYDRYVVPAARRLEARLRPPLGKNVLLIAEKP